MSTPPRRTRPSPAVFRRRRIVLITGVVLIALAVWLLIAQPWRGLASEGGSPDAGATPSAEPSTLPVPGVTTSPGPSAEPSAEASDPSASAAPPAVAACAADDILVEALTDKVNYAAGELPQMSIRLTNQGSKDCTLNVGTTQQAFTITSGDDTWWRSTDCQTEPSDMVVTIAAAQVVQSATPVPWDRTRSSVSTCAGDRPVAPGGGASYHLSVSIGGIESASTMQIFLY